MHCADSKKCLHSANGHFGVCTVRKGGNALCIGDKRGKKFKMHCADAKKCLHSANGLFGVCTVRKEKNALCIGDKHGKKFKMHCHYILLQVWEGVLTFVFFFLTVINAYIANRYAPSLGQKILGKAPVSFRHQHTTAKGPKEKVPGIGGLGQTTDLEAAEALMSEEAHPHMDAFVEHRRRFYDTFTEIRTKHPDMPLQEVARLTAIKTVKKEPKSRAFRRIQATRGLSGGKLKKPAIDLIPSVTTYTLVDPSNDANEPVVKSNNPEVTVYFQPCHIICVEDVGTVKVTAHVDRGNIQQPCVVTVHYRTIEGSAKEHSDYVPRTGELTFEPFENKKDIEIEIVDRDDYENDEEFYVQLYEPKAHHQDDHNITYKATVGAAFEATVIIVDDDHGGCFTFKSEVLKLKESCGYAYLTVNRTRGARGRVTLPFKVTDGSAKRGKDYECGDAELVFEDKQTSADIRIQIFNDDEYEKNEDFYIQLGQPVWHKENQIGEDGADGRPILGDHTRCKVVIIEDDQLKSIVDKAIKHTTSSIMVGTSSWKQQFRDAFEVNADDDDDGDDEDSDEKKQIVKAEREPTTFQLVMHYLNLPWKILFATIPPTDYMNGWICFIVSIIFIGLLTAVIGDVASMFGCTIGLKDVVTAITLVAVGTSVPDLFASKLATQQDPTADAAIGNVTGSNAVNVFLGIGIAWAMAAIFHWYKGTVFRVQAGSLGTSVIIFLLGSVICIGVLALRRKNAKIRGELGGPNRLKYASAALFVALWLGYVLINSLSAYCLLPF
uniref:Calx-beta domain protein n=1 Tax=Bursaphelenchus xylophilus TaxID=6326 RepID=A0A1I7S9Y8_BURXY